MYKKKLKDIASPLCISIFFLSKVILKTEPRAGFLLSQYLLFEIKGNFTTYNLDFLRSFRFPWVLLTWHRDPAATNVSEVIKLLPYYFSLGFGAYYNS